ncbi:WD40 repeat domain-containing serine/threonine protein kinase [Actinoallomurus iriomotensis]|nr:serine/threonine-protein kinase [Actinoallomurus iriomotensis]
MGTYRLLGRLGGGGMGQVFLGRSRGGRLVAVKVVRPELADDAGFRRRFAEEVAAARRAGGFYTAQVVDADPAADPPWLVTAFISGPSLQQAVQTFGPLPAHAVGVLGAGLAEGLTAIHAAGLVHRDLKPANIVIAADGPRVIDFGIARALDATHASTAVVGTPGFMSPEQARGIQVGPASDVFALGSVLTFAATGRGPFGTGTVEGIVYRVVHDDPDLSGIPAHLTEMIAACLAKDPARRPGLPLILDRLAAPTGADGAWLPPAVTAMIGEYDRELADHTRTPSSGRPPTARVRPWRPNRRDVIVAGLGAAAVAAAPAAFLLHSSRGHASDHPAPTPGRSGHVLRPGPPVTLHDGAVWSVTFSRDGRTLAGTGEDGKARLWDVATRTPAKTFTHQVVNPWPKPLDQVTGYNPRFTFTLSAAFSPDGTGLAVANGDGTIDLWDLATGNATTLPYLDKSEEWNTAVAIVAFDRTGGTLAATYNGAGVRLWDVSARKSETALTTGPDYWVQSLAFSPSGDLLATASGNGNPGNTAEDGLLQLWDSSSHTKIATLSDANTDVNSLAFSPDGRTLANLRNDGLLQLWDVTRRSPTRIFTTPGSDATCVAFGPDGILASGFKDGTVRLWDVTRRESATVLRSGAEDRISCVAVGPDGRTVAAGGPRLTMWTIK